MERLCVLVYETSEDIKKTLRDLLIAYSIEQDIEVVIQWLKPPIREAAVRKASAEAQLAFVNTDDPNTAVLIGEQVYQCVPDCALIYYGSKLPETACEVKTFLEKLFPARPVRFLDSPNRLMFHQALHELADSAFRSNRFCWENKGMRYRIPYESISYFRSDRNYVHIQLANGTHYSFIGKLTNVEQRLPKNRFVRIHQSYLVNSTKIDVIDKGRKTVLLNSGEEIYISKAHYKEALGV